MKITKQDRECLIAASELILQNPAMHFTIEELAAKVQLNREKLKYGFKQLYGTGVYEYQVQLRMELAKTLLLDDDKPIKEIAWKCGYEESSSFSKAFKRLNKLSPSTWRKQALRLLFVLIGIDFVPN